MVPNWAKKSLVAVTSHFASPSHKSMTILLTATSSSAQILSLGSSGCLQVTVSLRP